MKDKQFDASNVLGKSGFNFPEFNKKYHGKSCWVAGWGKIDYTHSRVSEQLLSVGLNFMSLDYCRENRNDYFMHVKSRGWSVFE